MADVTLIKTGGLLYGADDYSKAYIRKQPLGARLTLKVVNKKEKRRDVLNRLSHAIYNEAAKMKGDSYPEDEKAFMKYHHGIPVLRADPSDGEECSDYYRRLMSGVPYEQRIERMKETHKFYIPVTSLMNDSQMSEYIKRMLRSYAQDHGLIILTPKERASLEYPEAQQ